MSLLKYIYRLKRMDYLIRRKATGCAEEFAQKLGVSQSQLYQDLREMKELGAPISYCPFRKSYVYEREAKLILCFDNESRLLKGGNKISFNSSVKKRAMNFMFTTEYIEN